MRPKLRILVAESSAREISAMLETACQLPDAEIELVSAASIAALLATIPKARPDLLLLDLALARPASPETVRRICRAAPQVPLVVVASAGEKDEAARCLRQGAMDRVFKEAMDTIVVERLLRAAFERNTIEGLADLLRDSLTGLYSRDAFLTIGERKMESARRSGGTLVLACLFLENLGGLRECFGSSAEEQALLDVAGMLSASFRRSDVIARTGLAEFAVLAVDAAEPSAAILRQRIERHLMACNQSRNSGQAIELRLGVSFWQPEHDEPFAHLLDSLESTLRRTPALANAPGR